MIEEAATPRRPYRCGRRDPASSSRKITAAATTTTRMQSGRTPFVFLGSRCGGLPMLATPAILTLHIRSPDPTPTRHRQAAGAAHTRLDRVGARRGIRGQLAAAADAPNGGESEPPAPVFHYPRCWRRPVLSHESLGGRRLCDTGGGSNSSTNSSSTSSRPRPPSLALALFFPIKQQHGIGPKGAAGGGGITRRAAKATAVEQTTAPAGRGGA